MKWFTMACLALMACGSDPRSAGDDQRGSPASCDPIRAGCPDAQSCQPVCGSAGMTASFGCQSSDAAKETMCGTSGSPCASNSLCLKSPAGPTCRRYCSSEADCAGKPCEEVTISVICG